MCNTVPCKLFSANRLNEPPLCSKNAQNTIEKKMKNNKVVGVISVGDLVKSIIELQGSQIKFLETYINGHGV